MTENKLDTGSHQWSTDWTLLKAQAAELMSATRDPIACAANFSALLYQELEAVNWVGFYFLQDQALLLGPFQGRPACVHIPLGAGVCGTAAATGVIQRVADVHQFDGHIVCDAASNSEVVIPLHRQGTLIGVLDVDSPVHDRFSAEDEQGLSALADCWLEATGP